MVATNKTRVVVLISGSGSNLQALIDQSLEGTLPINIVSVISNNPAAPGLLRANSAGIQTCVVNNKDFNNKSDFEQALQERIDAEAPDLVVLAGFMRILGADFVNQYLGRMLNIHPSLLPKYRGLNTHQRALDADEKTHGASVHFVTPELDGGPVIIQSQVAIEASETSKTLAKKVLEREHVIFPIAITWFALKRIKLNADKVDYDGAPLEQPISFDT